MAAKPPTTICIILLISCFITTAYSLPFVVFHGINSSCAEIQDFTNYLLKESQSTGSCVIITENLGFLPLDEVTTSILVTIGRQVEIACEQVKGNEDLKDGYNIVGSSQGNIIGRGVIELCDGPPVKNFISVAGPNAGVASFPMCRSELECSVLAEYAVDILNAYTSETWKSILAPPGYFKVPTRLEQYINAATFFGKLNNEIPNNFNPTYKERFSSLENLVLIMSEDDKVLIPKETSLFGYYEDGSYHNVLPANQTKLYIDDLIGLKTLTEAGKVHFATVAGEHAAISNSDVDKYIIPFLRESTVSMVTM